MSKKSNVNILIGTITVSILAIGGWLVFTSLTTMFDLSNLAVGWQLVLGLAIIFIGTKLGLNRFKLN
jgi:hypothetical protein